MDKRNGRALTPLPPLASASRPSTPASVAGTLMTTDNRIHIVTKDQLPGPPEEGHHCVFANLTDETMEHFIRTMVLSARPELKGLAYLDMEVAKSTPSGDCNVVTVEATNTDIPLALISTDLHLKLDKLPSTVGSSFRVWLSKGFGK